MMLCCGIMHQALVSRSPDLLGDVSVHWQQGSQVYRNLLNILCNLVDEHFEIVPPEGTEDLNMIERLSAAGGS